MKLLISVFLTSILVACGGGGSSSSSAINDYVSDDQTSNDDSNDNYNDDATFELSSAAFTSGGEIPVIHACEDLGATTTHHSSLGKTRLRTRIAS